MSELKAIRSGEIYNIIEYEDCYRTDDLYYPKSEADKVIADLEESHKKEVGQLLIEIAELKKEKEYVVEQTAEVINGQERELQHHKRKRCLTMADWCEVAAAEMKVKHDFDPVNECKAFYYHRELWWRKWKNLWLELADKFKEADNGND